MYTVGNERGKIARRERAVREHEPVSFRGFDNRPRTKERNKHRSKVNKESHNRVIERQNLFRFREIVFDFSRRLFKFLRFVFFPHKRLHHTNPAHVLLHGIIQRVVLFKDTAEKGHNEPHNREQDYRQNRHNHDKNPRKSCIDSKAHNNRENKLQRHANNDTQTHLIGLLHVGNVGGKSCNQRRSGKLIHTCKGKFLHAIEKIVA